MDTQCILEKGTANINEDCLVMKDNIFGVFDGATSLTAQTFVHGKTGGNIAAQTAGSVFSRNHYPLTHLACQANREIMGKMLQNGVNISKKENLWSTTAAVVRVKKESLEWVQIGDAVIILIYEDGSHKVLANQEDHDYETLTLWKDLVSARVDNVDSLTDDSTNTCLLGLKKALFPQIKKVRLGMNIDYGVLNGDPRAENFFNQGTESLNRVTDILLFTDGLFIPEQVPEKRKDYTPLVKAYFSVGLNGVKDMVRQKEDTDPLCLAYPRFKCHDDIAAIAIKM
ncbi:Protein phosphatase 2C [Desulfocicer vacuolatum DSM 3385]|uniref:Protein phosphatase 2C n=1 Tax=Desulfocicer vacuolatum DSM 3385 TaxID=1121400 RepID=A0A1W2ELP4_9BACT|nr:protein phosphatase 2C domain-containing protein [Desulfocicer vacuolatum]SMD10216.1 Protein phosphatase 2C [Desulfocicer vacuolatum DSM 3385]